LKYDPQFWGMAFPLAMYTTSTYQLAKALNIPFLLVIPRFMIYIAMAVWLTLLIGLIHHLYLSFRAHQNTSSGQAFSWQRRGGEAE
jgi:tellurite resistance protein TehA-like permease